MRRLSGVLHWTLLHCSPEKRLGATRLFAGNRFNKQTLTRPDWCPPGGASHSVCRRVFPEIGGWVRWVVLRDGSLVVGGQLPRYWPTQNVDLFVLQQACKLVEGQKVNVDTDSGYAFRVCHDHGALWKRFYDELHKYHTPSPVSKAIIGSLGNRWQV